MNAVWVRLRSDLRSRWQAWLSLALLLGVFGGIVLTALAGARRTDTAYPRFLRSSQAGDVAIVGGEPEANAELERLPEVAAGETSARFFLNPVDASGRMDLGGGQRWQPCAIWPPGGWSGPSCWPAGCPVPTVRTRPCPAESSPSATTCK